MKHVYFVRHGQSEFNKSIKWAGSSDTPLTKLGHKQAIEAGKQLSAKAILPDIIICSPLQRAHDTAQHIAEQIGYPEKRILIKPALTERDFGILEGNKKLVAATRYMFDESAIDIYEGVESMDELDKRARKFVAYLETLDHETILLVGHGASGRAIKRVLKNLPRAHRGRPFGNAEVIKFV